MSDHPAECPGPVERHASTQGALPWGREVDQVSELCRTCGWTRRTTAKAADQLDLFPAP